MNTLERLTQRFHELNAQIEQAMAQMRSDSIELLEEAANEMFVAAPEITKIYWVQRTPYHNDGEPCEFSRLDIYYALEHDELDDYDEEGSYLYTEEEYNQALRALEEVKKRQANPVEWEAAYRKEHRLRDTYRIETLEVALKRRQDYVNEIEAQRERISWEDANRITSVFSAFCKTIDMIPDDVMKAAFGDHVRVIITKNGVETEHYEHD